MSRGPDLAGHLSDPGLIDEYPSSTCAVRARSRQAVFLGRRPPLRLLGRRSDCGGRIQAYICASLCLTAETGEQRTGLSSPFEESPDILLVLLPDAPRFTMVGATRARLAVTHTTREQIISARPFRGISRRPDGSGREGTRNLRASLDRVLATRAPDTMAVQKYDIPGPDGQFVSRYWSPKNIPVLAPSGEILYILHRVEDVTQLVRLERFGRSATGPDARLEREIVTRSRELGAANEALREASREAQGARPRQDRVLQQRQP